MNWDVVSLALIALAVLFLIAAGFVLYRGDWVYRHLVAAVDAGRTGLPSYNEAMWRFWVWDFEKLIKRDGR